MGRTSDNEVPAPQAPPADEGSPGRVAVDSRGRNVWQWAKAALDSTSILLKRLENKDLALEPTQKVPITPSTDSGAVGTAPAPPKPAARAEHGAKPADDRSDKKSTQRPDPVRSQVRRDGGGGFDPYNTR
jgi:hypothetical protein